MTTIEKIKMDGVEIIEKLKRNETISDNEREILKIYNSLYAKKSPLSGKRIVKEKKQKA